LAQFRRRQPRTDPGQFVINVKAPTGSHVDNTDKLIAQVEDIIRRFAHVCATARETGFTGVQSWVVDREAQSPGLETILALGCKA
jgi:multidrug efflux pump subunit AcrB